MAKASGTDDGGGGRRVRAVVLARVSTVQNELRAYYAPVSQLDQAKVDNLLAELRKHRGK